MIGGRQAVLVAARRGQIDAGDEKSCATPPARPVPVFVAAGRTSWNRTSFPAAAAVTPILNRTPTIQPRFAAVP